MFEDSRQLLPCPGLPCRAATTHQPTLNRFLSEGNDYRDCGHPCEKHSVQLRDSSGADHLVLADM
jgi:hypothetical protein